MYLLFHFLCRLCLSHCYLACLCLFARFVFCFPTATCTGAEGTRTRHKCAADDCPSCAGRERCRAVPDPAMLQRTCGSNLFPVPIFESGDDVWRLLEALAAATNRRFHAKLGASEVLGLQVVESADNAESNIIFMAAH